MINYDEDFDNDDETTQTSITPPPSCIWPLKNCTILLFVWLVMLPRTHSTRQRPADHQRQAIQQPIPPNKHQHTQQQRTYAYIKDAQHCTPLIAFHLERERGEGEREVVGVVEI